ncbi:inner-membrane translocator [Ancylobacter novellus DSM 506]|uniref:Inner-membrane translocator n=1 Tax=Ancylobacter novellus (strain ATCC 8093 / DSM 506 / JCM 20403 / CCM 1077 / IAM 12100 / NBRC 12443 / NCIMB 10456) TaxID=639283 RepID=D7AA85_ANCN5|nr:branched-chain amino acid ABC transporter permease [Ancylobacter novellus]ADH90872.1 inner-membrane translocator [Ancylobacter novellus DSM 506]
MSTVAQYVLSGLAIGGIYALVALGFHIMWSAARAVNFAHGDTLMIGGLLAAYLVASGWPLALACALAILVGGLFGFVLERLAVRPFAHQPNSIGWMLTTIAVGIMVESYATIETQGYALPLPSPGVAGSVQVLGAGLYPQELAIPVIALAAMLGLQALQRHTLIGRAMQAVAHNKNAAALMGINVDLVVAFSFSLASLLGAAAGVLIAPVVQASATMGLLPGLKGFAVAIMGGITSAPGVVITGLAYGVIEKFVEGYVSTAAREIVGFSLMIVVLLAFPQGLFGKREVAKV